MTDQELIEGIIRKDREAIHFLVNTYQRQVIKTAHYFLQDMQEAEDLSQEILIEILSSAHRFRQSAKFSTWIYRITVNRSLNQVKKMNRKKIVFRIGNLLRNDGSNPGEFEGSVQGTGSRLEEKETGRILTEAVGRLPENQRIAFVLCKYNELSYQEVSEVMNVSVSSVESLIHRAKMNLQKNLVRHFPEYKK
jgi:RNA polymerase sigma factor (sigma-70 family)